jgi:zinc protease
MPARLVLLFVVVLLAPLARAADASARAELPEVPQQTSRLKNGLTLILSEEHVVPLVTVYVTYRVGSKDELPGRTGFAHLFEHVMFQGSKHVGDDEHLKIIESVGGSANGNTTQDRTVYLETVPSNFLERALWLESDRMGFLLDTLDQAKLDTQRDVVKNERRQSYENRPYGLAYEKILPMLWPAGHPYSWPTIGSMADLTAASLEDVRAFFRRWYAPSNASVTIVGDFEPKQARALVERYFGDLPSGPAPEQAAPGDLAPLAKEVRASYEDNVQVPRLYLSWRTPKFLSPDDVALDVAASVLGGGRSSRLYRRLVFSEIASDIAAYEASGQLASTFQIVATARPGHTLEEIETIVNEELARLATEPPTAEEVATAQTELEASTTFGVESTMGRATRLAQYWQVVGDAGYLPKDVAAHRAVTPAEASRVAKTFLLEGQRAALSVLPRAPPPKAAAPPAKPPAPPTTPPPSKKKP